MKSVTFKAKMEALNIISSFSRPRVSNDNPYVESLFRTLKYCPQWPSKGFHTLVDAMVWVDRFCHWYNEEHRHSAIGFTAPSQRHEGLDIVLLANRREVYETARQTHPSRWSKHCRQWRRIEAVTLNPDKPANPAKRGGIKITLG